MKWAPCIQPADIKKNKKTLWCKQIIPYRDILETGAHPLVPIKKKNSPGRTPPHQRSPVCHTAQVWGVTSPLCPCITKLGKKTNASLLFANGIVLFSSSVICSLQLNVKRLGWDSGKTWIDSSWLVRSCCSKQKYSFKYLEVLWDGQADPAASAIIWALYWTLIGKRELGQKAKLSIG